MSIIKYIPLYLLSMCLFSCDVMYSETKPSLYSTNEDEILIYLRTHFVPDVPILWATSTSPSKEDLERWKEESQHAVNLFKKSSKIVRLEISKSLVEEAGQSIVDIWYACDGNDYEARHYIAGLVLRVANDNTIKDNVRQWLINRSHPSYASILVKYIDSYSLYDGIDEERKDLFIPWIKQLYRQKGSIRNIYKIHDPNTPDDYTLQYYVIGLLPNTIKGRDVLFSWLQQDSKKIDRYTLGAMWRKWRKISSSKLLTKDFLSSVIIRTDFIESWLLYSKYDRWHPSNKALYRTFSETIWKQIFNPDDQIRHIAIEFVINESDKHCIEFIKTIKDNPLREYTLTELTPIYKRLYDETSSTNINRITRLEKKYNLLLSILE